MVLANLLWGHSGNSLLTVVQTCRRQGRFVIDFFAQAIKAMVHPNVLAPSLILQL